MSSREGGCEARRVHGKQGGLWEVGISERLPAVCWSVQAGGFHIISTFGSPTKALTSYCRGWTASTHQDTFCISEPGKLGDPGTVLSRPCRHCVAAACTAAPSEPEAIPGGQAATQGVPRTLPAAGTQLAADCVRS